jgi:hypothetical protein
MASANSFFSLPFSTWRCFKRLASDTAEFALPVVESCLADPVFAAQTGRPRTQVALLSAKLYFNPN